jgi:hypothetical protein
MAQVRTPLLFLMAAGALALGCHAIEERIPTEPTATPSIPPLSIPVILPKASPTPSPAPAPAPNPSPTPAPNPTPTPSPGGGGGCSLPPSNPSNPSCSMESGTMIGLVDQALTRTVQSRPDLFNLNDKKCENCYYVKNVNGYVAEVQRQLAALGMCHIWDGEEIGVKRKNEFNEQYDILLASGHMRRGAGTYRSTCRPAWF